MTITFGSWAIPAVISLALLMGFFVWEAKQPPASGYGAIGDAFVTLLALAGTAIVALIVWLIWAIVR